MRFAPLAVDALLVIVFCAIGRRSHDEAVLAGLVQTVWPFAIGLLIGWALAMAVARNTRFDATALWPSGILIWLGTLAGGMALRAVSGQGVAVSFVIVAAGVLALFLLGWRAAAGALRS
ncbi:hypothetical protein BOX37_31555 [Nocardia mangyaensis]|uniref:DUF3054 domain-containing protein n=1 Tax=Nocardia mangyaensis TaxID=2213200 RepID=A0A1J0W081_9NOCA|nr:DUF3054 domain-containing protein [Nocardia mangyaensis]APE37723.1 hypothetical protein BOX37_31555 [Nocardia mangyaensis]MDO3649395.1 DUF3054 domain-containing protein [Nocardia mangyaensis]